MKPKHRIFISTENNCYSAWQAQLFYFSCVTRLRRRPTIIVHEFGDEWCEEFHELVRAGAEVRSAPSYSRSVNDHYLPRNTAGTLLHAAEICNKDEFIVLCDPDMIFVRDPDLPETLSGNFYSYMDYGREEVVAAAKQLRVNHRQLHKQEGELSCGVPYVIPVSCARPLAQLWLQAVDAFSPRHWIDIMHAFGLAVVRLGLRVLLTDVVDDNERQQMRSRRPMIHYCYGDDVWDKRHFLAEETAKNVWLPQAAAKKGSILAEIQSQISESRRFYGNPYFSPRTNGTDALAKVL